MSRCSAHALSQSQCKRLYRTVRQWPAYALPRVLIAEGATRTLLSVNLRSEGRTCNSTVCDIRCKLID